MFFTISETEGEVGPVNSIEAPPPPVIHYWPLQGGGSVVVLCCSFGVRVSVAFHHMFVQIILVWFELLSGHLFGKS